MGTNALMTHFKMLVNTLDMNDNAMNVFVFCFLQMAVVFLYVSVNKHVSLTVIHIYKS